LFRARASELPGSWRSRLVSSCQPRGGGCPLGAGEVAGGGAGVDELQFDGRRAVQQCPARGLGHLGAAGQQDQPEGGLLAQCPQHGRPQVPGDLIQPVQDHRDPALIKHAAGRPGPLPGGKKRVGLPKPLGQPVPGALGAGVPPVQGKHHRHRHLGPDLVGDAPPMAQRGQDQQHRRAALAGSRAAGDHQPPRPQSHVHPMQPADLARPQPLLSGGGQPGQRREPRRGHRGRRRPGDWRGRPSPSHRNGFLLQQPPFPGRRGPLRLNCPGPAGPPAARALARKPARRPGCSSAAIPRRSGPRRYQPPRWRTPRSLPGPRGAETAIPRQPGHGDHRDDPDRGKWPQAASSPAHGHSLTANIGI
jgi:hypothetical protein